MRKIILLAVFIIYFAAIAGAQMYYNIVLYSPVADAVFYLGEKIDFRMEVMEGTEKISGANAVANLPGATLALSESGGAYTGNYTLKWNDNPGI